MKIPAKVLIESGADNFSRKVLGIYGYVKKVPFQPVFAVF
jgi:hypothetical protein